MNTLLQVLPNGSVSASWVLVIVVSLCGVLALIIFNDIRNSIKAIIARVDEQGRKQNEQEKEIAKTSIRTDYAHERIDEILHTIKK